MLKEDIEKIKYLTFNFSDSVQPYDVYNVAETSYVAVLFNWNSKIEWWHVEHKINCHNFGFFVNRIRFEDMFGILPKYVQEEFIYHLDILLEKECQA